MNETTSNPATPSTPPSDRTPDAVVPTTPAADATPPADGTPPAADVPTDTTPPAAAPTYTTPPTYTPPPAAPQPTAVPPSGSTRQPIRLRRSRDERMIAGVCGGLAETLGVDATILRLALVLATVLGVGAGVIIYVACWILMPRAPESTAGTGATPYPEAATDLLPAVRPTA